LYHFVFGYRGEYLAYYLKREKEGEGPTTTHNKPFLPSFDAFIRRQQLHVRITDIHAALGWMDTDSSDYSVAQGNYELHLY
jgi:hypothetical protein